MGDKQFNFEERKGWLIFLTLVMFICVVLIFLNALGWLSPIGDYIGETGVASVVTAFVFLLVVGGTIAYVVGGKPKEKSGGS